MAEPLSPDHVFDFPMDDPVLDVEDPDMEVEEDPAEAIPPVVGSPPRASWVPPPGSTFEVRGPSSIPSPPPYLLDRKG
ncbi:hypothetical protein Tco_0591519 [Tanacetum coccineum]